MSIPNPETSRSRSSDRHPEGAPFAEETADSRPTTPAREPVQDERRAAPRPAAASGEPAAARGPESKKEKKARLRAGKNDSASRKALDDSPRNWGAFRAAVALYGIVIMAYGIWQILAGTGSLPEQAGGSNPTVASSYSGLAAVLVGVGASLLAIAIKFQWANLLSFMCFALFLGGIGRILSWAIFGLPHWSMIVLMVLDLVLPPCLLVWYGWINKSNSIRREMAAEANGQPAPQRPARRK